MENQYQTQVRQPLPKKPAVKNLTLLALLIIVLLSAVGYGVYAWQQTKVTKLNKDVTELSMTIDTLKAEVSEISKEQVKTDSNSTSQTKINEYAGWKTFTSKFGTTFKHPADYTVFTQIDTNSTLQQAINNGTNIIEVTSYVPDGKLKCAQVGQTIPACEVKVSFQVLNGKVESVIVPQNSALKSVAQKIINSLK